MIDRKGQELYGAMIPQERGLEGISTYFYILFTHYCFNGE
jgi:hypothetical protein